MKLAIDEANKSIPLESAYCVGAVLVNPETNTVLATGFSRELPGNTHAEECCFLKLQNQEKENTIPSAADLMKNSTIYTTMEPCSKRLSGNKPCVDHILNYGVSRVVMGVKEPQNFVHCTGVQLLRDKGVEVTILDGFEEECLKPNRHLNLKL